MANKIWAVRVRFERIATVALLVLSAKKMYLKVRKKYIFRKRTRRLGAGLDCYVACCRPDEEDI